MNQIKLPETPISLVIGERMDQLTKHNRTLEHDRIFNADYQLSTAASDLAWPHGWKEDVPLPPPPPVGWNEEIWKKMISKPYKERLIIAGALILAELDRIMENKPE